MLVPAIAILLAVVKCMIGNLYSVMLPWLNNTLLVLLGDASLGETREQA